MARLRAAAEGGARHTSRPRLEARGKRVEVARPGDVGAGPVIEETGTESHGIEGGRSAENADSRAPTNTGRAEGPQRRAVLYESGAKAPVGRGIRALGGRIGAHRGWS